MIIMLLCQGLIFETSNDTFQSETAFAFFGVLTLLIVCCALTTSMIRTVKNLLRKQRELSVKYKCFHQIPENVRKDILDVYIAAQISQHTNLQLDKNFLSANLPHEMLQEIYSAVDRADELETNKLSRLAEDINRNSYAREDDLQRTRPFHS
jgi:hypothetical protein